MAVLSILATLFGCGKSTPAWVSDQPATSPCGAATVSFPSPDAVVKASFADVVELPNGVRFCSTDHRMEDNPERGESGKVSVITFALTNPGTSDFTIDNLSKNLRAASGAPNAVGFVMTGYIGQPKVLHPGDTAMMRFVYDLPQDRWSTASGLYEFNDQWAVRMTGLS